MKFLQYVETMDAGLFRTIVADPPWDVQQGSTWKTRFTDKARPQRFYPTMDLEAIKGMRIPVARQAHLYLWVVNQHVNWGWEVANAWGFDEYVQILTWAKPGRGVGRFQSNTEHCLLFRKGGRRGNAFGQTAGTHYGWDRGRHSAKPDDFYSLVEATSPGPYLELFSRKCRPGWTCLGNEVGDKQDINQSLAQPNFGSGTSQTAPSTEVSPPPMTKNQAPRN